MASLSVDKLKVAKGEPLRDLPGPGICPGFHSVLWKPLSLRDVYMETQRRQKPALIPLSKGLLGYYDGHDLNHAP